MYTDSRSRKAVIIVSTVLLFAGIVGIACPQFMTMAVAWFVGGLMLVAGGIMFYGEKHDHL